VRSYFERLKKVAPSLHAKLYPGASEKAIAALEETIGCALPAEVRALLALADGQTTSEIGAVYGLELLSCTQIALEWKTWRDVRDDGGIDELDEDQDVLKPGTIQQRYTVAGWIPLFRFPTRADYLGVDLAPGKKGQKGQIINFGRDEEEKYVAAPGVTAFFALLDGWLEKESKGEDARVVEDHVSDLFARAGLAMERCYAIASGDDFELEPPPAPGPPKPKTAQAPFDPPAAIADEARAFLAYVEARLARVGRRAIQAHVEIVETQPGHTQVGMSWKPTKGGSSQFLDDVSETMKLIRPLFAAAQKHGLPPRIHMTFVREGATWSREVKSFCQ
jgi:cell wall assembly regulator SMI1